jgi:glutathione peroxidase-family protein
MTALMTGAMEPLKGFDLTTGKQIRLAESKYRVVVFLSAKCPCSQSHEEKLKKLSAEYKSAGFQFVAIHSNANEDERISKEHFREYF